MNATQHQAGGSCPNVPLPLLLQLLQTAPITTIALPCMLAQSLCCPPDMTSKIEAHFT
jgi:hypothetical protein